jgi:hypothetical protein
VIEGEIVEGEEYFNSIEYVAELWIEGEYFGPPEYEAMRPHYNPTIANLFRYAAYCAPFLQRWMLDYEKELARKERRKAFKARIGAIGFIGNDSIKELNGEGLWRIS